MTPFERTLGHGRVVAIAVDDPDDATLAELHPDERARAEALAPLRRREWVAGRRALRRALPAPAEAALLADERGAPVLPRGTVGSVSHKRELAVALAAHDDGWTRGVDLEQPGPRRIDLSPRILTAAERARLGGVHGLARDRAVILAFALKEAIYKAIDPHLRRYVGFQEVAVWLDEPAGAGEGLARVEPLVDWGLEVEAAWVDVDRYLVCTARARRR